MKRGASKREMFSKEDLKKGALDRENLVLLVLNAVEAEATMGEICDALKEVYGEYREVSVF